MLVPIQVTPQRSPELPDVPAIGEFAKDERTRGILQLILAPQDMDRPILAPPGVPMERVTALRTAFHEAMNDPAFRAEAKKERLTVQETSGAKLGEILARSFALPADVVRDAKDAMSLANAK